MDYRHYAAAPVTLDRERVYEHEHGMKPDGFWVSVPGEDDWPSWCRQEDYALDSLGFEHQVTIAPTATLRVVAGADDLDAFHDEFSAPRPTGWDIRDRREYRYIDWNAVAARYDGIVIAPYIWERRLFGPSWYYSWDVASGCVWNLDAILSVDVAPALVGPIRGSSRDE